jgi:thiol-disulfide isomerase/thioredoxin
LLVAEFTRRQDLHRGSHQPKCLRFLGRLSPLIALVACDRGSPPSPTTRSESIAAGADGAPSGGDADASAAPHASAASAPRRKLCADDLSYLPQRFPKGTFTAVAAAGATPPSERLSVGSGRWTWINFFAAWCGPCKEEMPRIRGMQQKLASRLDVVFVSLDDDERQLRQFLDAQGDKPSGVRSALWFQPGKARATWLSSLTLKESPDLPAHVFVDGAGKVRCIAGGAVEDADLPTLTELVRP